MNIHTLLLASTITFVGNAYADTDLVPIPNTSNCFAHARTPHDRELCSRFKNCAANESETNQDLRTCELNARHWHGAAHKDYLQGVGVPENVEINVSHNTAPVEVIVEEAGDQGGEMYSLLDPARSNSDLVAGMTGSRGQQWGPN